MTTYYKLLGVAADADFTVIKAAYRKALKEHHPDLNSGAGTAEHLSRRIIDAYEVLKDPELRAGYDETLRHGRTQNRRILLIVALVSAGLVTTASLMFLHLAVAARDEAPPSDMLMASDQARRPAGPAFPGDADSEHETPLQSAPHEAEWQAIERTGGIAEVWAFAKAYPKKPEGKLAEIRLAQLIDASEDAAALHALSAEAAGGIADRARSRLQRLTRETPVVTASLPQDVHTDPQAGEVSAPPAEVGPHPSDALAVMPAEAAPADVAPRAEAAISESSLPDHAALAGAVGAQPVDAGGFLRRASAWLARGDTTRAMADYDAAIRLEESSIPALHGRGLLWFRLGEVERALADLDHAIRLSFEDARIYRDRGAIWLAKGRYDRAIADLDRAIKLAPDYAQAYLDRGMAYQGKGDSEKADANFTEALRKQPGLAPSLRRAGPDSFDQTVSDPRPTLPH